MKKKRTFFRNVLAIYLRNERWWSNPKNSDKIMLFYQYNFQIGVICFLSIFMIGCKVHQPIIQVQYKTIEKVRTELQHDSIYSHDSTVVWKDSLIERWHQSYKYKYIIKTDTLIKTDTITKLITRNVEVIKNVQVYGIFWWSGLISLCLIAGYIAFKYFNK